MTRTGSWAMVMGAVLVLAGCGGGNKPQATCTGGQTACAGACVTLATDATNCGACGKVCNSGQVCVQGACQVPCTAPEIACGNTCVDPSTSSAYCGATADCTGANAGTACTAAETCVAGACQSTDATLSNLTVSAGTLDPAFDPGTPDYTVTAAYAFDTASVTPTAADPGATLTVDGAALASGTASAPAPLTVATPKLFTIVVTAAAGNTATYRVSVTRRGPGGITAASGADRGDGFGYAVAISGDTLVVGAPYEDSNATTVDGNELDNSAATSGAAYVFTRDASNHWTQQAYLKPRNNRAGAQFGSSVAIDGNTVVVGAPYESSAATGVGGNGADTSAPGAGAAYVFERAGAGIWSQRAYLKASNTQGNDLFGYRVAISGDTVAVSAYSEASNATGIDGDGSNNADPGAGAVYVFTRATTGAWAQQAYVKASNTNPHDFFGTSVALDGDTLVVGAQSESSSATGVNGDETNNAAYRAGAAYVFARDTAGAWAQTAYLKASNTGAGDLFGRSVSVSGRTVVVGAANEGSSATGVGGDQTDNSATGAGAAYVFTESATGTWSQQAYLKASNTDPGDVFGQSVAVDHDLLVVSALYEASSATGVNGDQTDNSLSKVGAAYLFTRDGAGTWSWRAYLKGTVTAPSDFFGTTVSLSGDTAVAGAPETPKAGGSSIGAVYTF